MSKWSGKCDFADTCEMYSESDILHGKVYMEDALIDFKNDYKNVIPYYPHIVASMASSKWDDPNAPLFTHPSYDLSIFLRRDDYFDERETTARAVALNDLVYKIQKTKKNKADYKDRVAFAEYWKDERCQQLAPIEKAIYEKSDDDQLDFLASLKVKFDPKSLDTYWAVYKALADEMYHSVVVKTIMEQRERFYNYCVDCGVPEDNPKFKSLMLKIELAKNFAM